MFGYRRSVIYYFLVPVLLVFLLALVSTCSEQMTGIQDKSGDTGGFTGSGEIDPGASGSFLLGTAGDSVYAPGRIEVWAMDVAYDSSTGMVTFDVVLLNATNRPIAPPIHFVITTIIPQDIAVVDFDGVSEDGLPFYDFSTKLGPDNVLEPGEATERVMMKFHTVEPRSFAIGFRIDLGPPPEKGLIVGVVFYDYNKNGVRDRCDRCEPGIPGITIGLEMTLTDGDTVILITRTDTNGEYKFWGLDEGVYKIHVRPSPGEWEITSANPLLVTLVKGPDGEVQDFYGANFGLFPIEGPAGLMLFGPIIVGPPTPFGTLLDSTFVNPPSPLTVIFNYYLEVTLPPIMGPFPIVIDTAFAWINNELVFNYQRILPPDSIPFEPQRIKLPEDLVHVGMNDIRLFVDGNEYAVLEFRVLRK